MAKDWYHILVVGESLLESLFLWDFSKGEFPGISRIILLMQNNIKRILIMENINLGLVGNCVVMRLFVATLKFPF